MVFNFQRPNLPYEAQSLPNAKRYQLLTRSGNRPPTDIMLDTDFDYIIDGMRDLDLAIVGVGAGILPGAGDINNVFKLPVTDGASHIGWVKITDNYIGPHSITNLSIMPQTITATEIQDGTITSDKIADGAVGTPELDGGSVTTGKIAALAVTNTELAANAVTADKLAADSVTTIKILDANVTADKLAADSVTTIKILNANVTTDKLAANAVTEAKILDANVTTGKLAANAVTAAKIANDTITFTQINSSFTATQAQQQAASSSSVYVSPARQQYHPSAVKARVLFNGSNGTIIDAYNVSLVTRVSSGKYRITFPVAFADTNYSPSVTCIASAGYASRLGMGDNNFPPTQDQMQIVTLDATTDTPVDAYLVSCQFYGTLA
jgi:hypothetical protein